MGPNVNDAYQLSVDSKNPQRLYVELSDYYDFAYTIDATAVSPTWNVTTPTADARINPTMLFGIGAREVLISVSITGNSAGCSNPGVELTAVPSPAIGDETYQWYLNGDVIIGATLSTYSAVAAGNYTVHITSDGGTLSAISPAHNVAILDVSAEVQDASFTTGPASLCLGATKTLHVVAIIEDTYTSYQWYSGETIIVGATGSTLVVTGDGTGDTHNYYAIITNTTGCSGASAAYSITHVRCIPEVLADGLSASPVSVCSPLGVTLVVTNGPFSSYQWHVVDYLGNIISTVPGANSDSYIATFSAGTSYCSVTVTDAFGCTGVSSPFQIDTITITADLVVTSAMVSVVQAFESYQWYIDDVLAVGETGSSIAITVAGVYRVDLIDVSGCTASASVEVTPISTGSFPGQAVCTSLDTVGVASLENLPSCQASFGFTTTVRNSMPSGRYSVEYPTGIDINLSSVGKWMYMGSNSKTLVYDAPPHLGFGGNPNDGFFVGNGNLGSTVYDAGYVSGSHFPANALLLETRLMDRQMSNSAKDDRLGISPCKTYNKQSTFSDSDRHSLMVMHYENCIDNSASFHALYDKLFLVEGQFNEAAAFTLSPLIVDNLQYVDIGEGTIMMWAKRLCTETGRKYFIIDMEPFRSTDLIQPAFSLYIDERDRLVFEIVGFVSIPGTEYVRKDVYAVRYPITNADLGDTSKFTHVAITWKNGPDASQNFMRLYINGNKQSILKYDTGAKFGISELTDEDIVMGDYVDYAAVDTEVACFNDGRGNGAYCSGIYSPSPMPDQIPIETLTAFAHILCPDVSEQDPAFEACLASVTKNRLLYNTSRRRLEWNNGELAGKWVILKNKPLDSTKDQVRQILSNNGLYLLVDRPWDSDNLPITDDPTVTFSIVGQAYFITARVDKFMQTKLKSIGLPPNVSGLKRYFNQFVLGAKEAFPNKPDLAPCSDPSCPTIWPYNGQFSAWLDMLNTSPSYKHDSVPTDFVDIKSTGKEVRHLSVLNSSNIYDFPHIYIGSDKTGKMLGNLAIDQLAFYNRALSDEELSVYYGPAFIDTAGADVTLGYDFNADNTPVYKFTTLQDEKGRSFESYINVLNPFSLPIDKDLLTNLLNMVKPANSTFFINYS